MISYETNSAFSVGFPSSNSSFNIKFNEQSGSDTVPPYLGNYTITPKTSEQSMSTAGKKMLQDVTIKAVPYYETSNSKGKTVYIAMEV